jgi:hypothetical protein
MRVRSAHFATLTMVGCCALMRLGHDARGADPAVAPVATAVALPDFRAGLWEYRRILVTTDSARPRFATLRKCSDPSTDIRRKMAQLRSRGCEFSPFTFRDGGYVSSWTCPTPHGPIGFRHVLIVRDPTSYLAISETRFGGRVIQQKLEARRLGECPGAEGDAPANPAGLALPPAQK